MVNGSFTVELYNAPPATSAVLVIGISNKTWSSIALPLDLTGFGSKGCALLASQNLLVSKLTTGTGTGNGQAIYNLTVPNDPALKNATLYFQGLVLDLAANAMMLTTSNGLAAVVQ